MGYTLEFRDFASGASLSSAFQQTPEAAVSFFRDKGLQPTFSYADMIAEEHVAAFTVAKMLDVDLLADVSTAVDEAIANGDTIDEFRKKLTPHLQKKGWWGKADVTDPSTGKKSTAQLGSAHRLETIYRSNAQAAYSAGQWDTIRGQADDAPYLMYDAVDDHRTRPTHALWDNTVLRVDDPWWQTHYPPNGFNCRCGVIQLDKDQLGALGIDPSKQAPPIKHRPWTNPKTGEVEQIPEGIDPGWAHHIGKARQNHLEQVLKGKIDALPQGLKAAAPAVQELADKAWTQGRKVADEELANLDPDTVALQRLQEIEANNEPYLASALKQVNKTKKAQDMTPSQKLEAVEAKAAKQKQNSDLAHYKQAKIKGKDPGPDAKAAYANLPEQAQADMDEAINAQVQKAAEIESAQATLDDIEANPQGQKLKADILAKMKANGEDEGMGPVALLDEVNARYVVQQNKKQQASALSGYKKKVLAGKTPTPAQQQAFESMNAADQDAFLDKLDKAKAAQAKAAAPEPEATDAPTTPAPEGLPTSEVGHQIDDVVTDVFAKEFPVSSDAEADVAQALKWMVNPDAFDEPDGAGLKVLQKAAQELTQDTLQEVADIAAKHGTQAKFADLLAENKVPVPDGVKFKALDDAAEPPADPKPADAPAPVAAAEPEAEIDPQRLTKIGGQKGSNPGGTYQDPETGRKWYIKTPDSEDNARNEVLAGKLYEAAGVDVPELDVVKMDQGPSVASQIIDGLDTAGPDADWSGIDGAHRNFVVDAWLGNWDVIGQGFDNLLVKGGRAVRVDTGGALRYRAQGTQKTDSQWTAEVQEIDTLRDPGTNPQAARAFEGVTHDDMVAGARKVLAIDDEQIRALVRANGPTDMDKAEELAAMLIARKRNLAERFPEAAERPASAPPPASAGQRVTDQESREIDDARSNGVAMRTDGDQIEDQQVLVWRQRDQDGHVFTNADLKVRGEAARQLDEQIEGSATKPPDLPEQAEVEDRIIEAARGIGGPASKEGLRDVDFERVTRARNAYDSALAGVKARVADGELDAASIEAVRERFEPWIDALEKAAKGKAGEAPDWNPPAPKLEKGATVLTKPERPEADKPAIEWTRNTEYPWSMARFDRGFAQDTGDSQRLGDPTHYEAFLPDGRRILYFPSSSGSFALRNRMIIEASGEDADAAEGAIDALAQLGIRNERAGELDAEELYLTQIAYHRRDGYREFRDATRGISDQGERVAAMKRTLSEQIGEDVTALPNYRPQGAHEAFGHGLVRRERPDLDTAEFRKFAREHELFHMNTRGSIADTVANILKSGGKMAPNTDRLRRGIPHGGMSPDRDMETGGASYFFTRIREKGNATPGFYWKADHVKRLDAISYDSDYYGQVVDEGFYGPVAKGDNADNFVQRHRHTGPDEWRKAARRDNNETIFKGGLSLFDGLDRIQTASRAERDSLLQTFRDEGYTEWPDGRALEDVIK